MRSLRLVVGCVFWIAVTCAIVTLSIDLFGPSEGEVALRDPTLWFDDPVSGREYDLSPVITNGTRRPIRVIGAGANCGSNGCVSVAGLPVEIAPGESHPLDVRFEAGVPGRFVQELPIYTDWPSQPYLVLRIEGVVRSGDPSDDREPTDE